MKTRFTFLFCALALSGRADFGIKWNNSPDTNAETYAAYVVDTNAPTASYMVAAAPANAMQLSLAAPFHPLPNPCWLWLRAETSNTNYLPSLYTNTSVIYLDTNQWNVDATNTVPLTNAPPLPLTGPGGLEFYRR